MRVLIADDNELVRRGVAAMLASREGCVICGEAADGAEALWKSRELLPDLLLLDIKMPGISGWETARLLRCAVPEAKIVIMSQNDPTMLLRKAVEAGADSCVDKIRLSSELLTTIDALWEGRVGGEDGRRGGVADRDSARRRGR